MIDLRLKTGSLKIDTIVWITIVWITIVFNDTEKNYITKRKQNSLTCSFATKPSYSEYKYYTAMNKFRD